MAYSVNRQPLLRDISDSEFEDEIENEIEDTRTAVPDSEPFIKTLIPQDRYRLYTSYSHKQQQKNRVDKSEQFQNLKCENLFVYFPYFIVSKYYMQISYC